MEDVLTELYEVVTQRHENPQEGSYTCYLFDDVKAELSKRHQKSGNLKKFHQVDKNT